MSSAIILASGSPRRKELLEAAGYEVCCRPPNIDETPRANERPDEFVCRMAREKGEWAAIEHPNQIVVSADTIIALEDEIIGKPENRQSAMTILSKLSGRTHQVLTGICIHRKTPLFLHNWFVKASVRFHPLSVDRLEEYLDESNWQDKAGAYAIQEHGASLVASFSGMKTTIIGLPIEQVAERIDEALKSIR